MVNHKNVKLNLIDLITKFPHLANNYNELCSMYWGLYDDVNSLSDIAKATPVETINRSLRKLASVGEVKVSPRRPKKEEVKPINEFSNLV